VLKGSIELPGNPATKTIVGRLIEILLPLLLLAALIALCAQLLFPFVGLLLWTIILAVCFYPLHRRLTRRMSNGLSATVIGAALAILILVPTAIASISAATSIPALVSGLQSGDQKIPPPPDALNRIPVVGGKIHQAWGQASTDLPAFAKSFGPQLSSFTKWLLGAAGGMLAAILALLLAVIFAAITLAYSDSARAFISSVFARVTGDRTKGEHYISIIAATIRSVANGVIGVAFVQALLCGIGFFAIGVPGAGLLSLVAMVFGVLQVPVVLITLPAIIWAFSAETMTVAIIFTIWEVISGLSDAALKPLMIGHGLEVPMPIILLGVIGGVIAYGLVGLFIGAVLLAVGYVLFREWSDPPVHDSSGSTATLLAAE
jgi:predicted PurR-regulated permease PerM